MSEKPAASETAETPVEPTKNILQRIFVRTGKLSSLLLPILAVFSALVIGAVIIAVSSPEVLTAWKTFSQDPLGESLSR